MIQYILTGLAGLALGIVGMRIWQMRESAGPATPGMVPTESSSSATPAGGRTRYYLIAAGALAFIAVAVFLLRSGNEPSPEPAGSAVSSGASLADVDTMISRLAARLENEPDDGEGFRMLGWSYVMTGRPDEAIKPYERALELLPESAIVHAGYGEALVGVAGGNVTEEAKAEFDKAHGIDPQEPRSRYFLAMWLAQHGRKREALDQWIELANAEPADAPSQAELRSQIEKTAQELGLDVSARLKNPAPANAAEGATQISQADVAAVTALPPDEQQASINSMVDGLAERLKTESGDVEGWVTLFRSRMVLKQADKAGKDLAIARKALAGDSAGLRRVNEAAATYGVPGA